MTRGKSLADADEILSKLAAQDAHRTDVRDLLRHILREFDGNAGLAKHLRDCYDESPPGGSNQARILADIMKLVDRESEHQEDYGDMSMEELQLHATDLMRGLQGDDGTGPPAEHEAMEADARRGRDAGEPA